MFEILPFVPVVVVLAVGACALRDGASRERDAVGVATSIPPWIAVASIVALAAHLLLSATHAAFPGAGALPILPVLFDRIILVRRRLARLGARVRNLCFNACPTCLYDLRAVHGPGRCPECGRLVNTEELAKLWQRRCQSVGLFGFDNGPVAE